MTNWETKQYRIPPEILNSIKTYYQNYNGNKKIQGYGFAQNCIKNGYITGHLLKKLKNTLDEKNELSFNLMGGQNMLNFVNLKLDNIRELNDNRKKLNDFAGKSNAYRKAHTKSVSPLSESFIIFFA